MHEKTVKLKALGDLRDERKVNSKDDSGRKRNY